MKRLGRKDRSTVSSAAKGAPARNKLQEEIYARALLETSTGGLTWAGPFDDPRHDLAHVRFGLRG
jgi:hypothetical protein